jgi:cell division protein FtsB
VQNEKLEKLKAENSKTQASINNLLKDVKEKEKERNKNAGEMAVKESELQCEEEFVCSTYVV